MIRASFSMAPRIAPPSARHSAALAGAACRTFFRHFRFHSFCATRLSRSRDRKSTRLNSSHLGISYAVFCFKKKKHTSELQSLRPLLCRLLLEKKKETRWQPVFNLLDLTLFDTVNQDELV